MRCVARLVHCSTRLMGVLRCYNMVAGIVEIGSTFRSSGSIVALIEAQLTDGCPKALTKGPKASSL